MTEEQAIRLQMMSMNMYQAIDRLSPERAETFWGLLAHFATILSDEDASKLEDLVLLFVPDEEAE